MDTDLKTKWLAALRSGDFEQGKNFLHNPKENTYCCLGVLLTVKGVPLTEIDFRCTTNISEWLPDAIDPHQCSILGDVMNDDGGKSFTDIADYIEENL